MWSSIIHSSILPLVLAYKETRVPQRKSGIRSFRGEQTSHRFAFSIFRTGRKARMKEPTNSEFLFLFLFLEWRRLPLQIRISTRNNTRKPQPPTTLPFFLVQLFFSTEKGLRLLLCCLVMRFFLEFVSCCGSLPRSSEDVSKTESAPVRSDETQLSDETQSLVPPVSRTRRRKKRGRLGTSAVIEWRPSLGSISEDIPLPPRGDTKNSTVEPERNAKRRSSSTAKARRYRDDYG